ncbi:hypothetical protein AURDEDRAFT_119144 [Auricularia subglabra TFB-10046 SS5]|nr:hypothetical protein AURDEDRAFT_119144 [Auricularia subglabra TFB-10046 SS5]
MRLRLYRADAGFPDVQRCASALAQHFVHTEHLSVTSFSLFEFRSVVGPALQRSSPSLRTLYLRICSEISVSGPVRPGDGPLTLRSVAPKVRPVPGGSLPGLRRLVLEYPVTLKQLLKLLAHTPALEVLYLRQGVAADRLPSESIDPGVQQLRLREFVCERTRDWARLFTNILPLAHVKNLAAVPVGPLAPAGRLLFEGMGEICAVGLDGSQLERYIAFTDVRGYRRLLATEDSLRAVLEQAGPLHDVQCLSILASRLSLTESLLWDLQAMSMDRLRTILYELEGVLLNDELSTAERHRLVKRLSVQARCKILCSFPADGTKASV